MLFLPILGGARAGCAPPESAPDQCYTIYCHHKQNMILIKFYSLLTSPMHVNIVLRRRLWYTSVVQIYIYMDTISILSLLTCPMDRIKWLVCSPRVLNRGKEPDRVKPRTYCFSAKQAALRSTCKDWLARNQNNVSEWMDVSTLGLLFHWDRSINIHIRVLV